MMMPILRWFLVDNRVNMIRNDPKLLDDSGEIPKPSEVVDGLMHGREIISLLDGKTTQVVKCLLCSKNIKKEKI